MLQDRVTALRTANIYERQSYRHIIGLPVIGANEADSIGAETPFLVARIIRDGRTELFATGVYLDRIRDEAGSLRFAERLVAATAVISIRCWPFRFERSSRPSFAMRR
jgi:anthranilate 1,2-dioxygenase small subunit/terephthalate 1,2-dioxygenase oxygenase component beta subunit